MDPETTRAVFKAYDIRGIAGDPLTASFALRLGRATATYLDCDALAVCRDIRESGPELHAAFVEGLLAGGVDVHDIGIMPTGALYRATLALNVDGGVAITASHNPPEYNGFKFCRGPDAMAGDELQELWSVFEVGEFRDGVGEHIEIDDFLDLYFDAIIDSAGIPERRVRLVIDSGNAVPGPYIEALARLLGADATCILCEWDNSYPVHPPDPTRPANMELLGEVVVETGAEFGIGIDGREVATLDRLHFVHDPGRGSPSHVAEILASPKRVGVSKDRQQLCIVIKHFFKVRNAPLIVDGIAVKAPGDVIPQPPAGHFPQGFYCHLVGRTLRRFL